MINLNWLSAKTLQSVRRGIEKEGLRMQADGFSAKTPHPKDLGSKLTHPAITTDYSENLLELITTVHDSIDGALDELTTLHQIVHNALQNSIHQGELMWPLSMPCMLSDNDDDIMLADYGTSNVGRLKTLYRSGLGVRYGRKMQTIAGLHYNLSFGDEFFEGWQQAIGDLQSLMDFKNDKYLALIRNFKRLSPLVLYLTGASPSVCACFVQDKAHDLIALDDGQTYYLPFATSLRMGKLGYTNSVQDNLDIRYNNLSEYIQGLRAAIFTPYQPFSDIGIDDQDGKPMQINDHILQIENEYYSPIRPKQVSQMGENPSDALKNRGIGYVEFRAIDLNPYEAIGINKITACFLEVLALYCLIMPSDDLFAAEEAVIAQNIDQIVNFGRKTGIQITLTALDGGVFDDGFGDNKPSIDFQSWLYNHLDKLKQLAPLFDKAYGLSDYAYAIDEMITLIDNPDKTLSARLIKDSQAQGGTWQLGAWLAKKHQDKLLSLPMNEQTQAKYQRLADDSWAAQKQLEDSDTVPFEEYIQAYRALDGA